MAHPYHLAGGMNLFDFSMPYLAEKVLDMLFNILEQIADPEDLEEDTDTDYDSNLNKVLLGKIMKISLYIRGM